MRPDHCNIMDHSKKAQKVQLATNGTQIQYPGEEQRKLCTSSLCKRFIAVLFTFCSWFPHNVICNHLKIQFEIYCNACMILDTWMKFQSITFLIEKVHLDDLDLYVSITFLLLGKLQCAFQATNGNIFANDCGQWHGSTSSSLLSARQLCVDEGVSPEI